MKRRTEAAVEDVNEHIKIQAWMRSFPEFFDKSFPFFRQPVELGRFSLDENRRFRHDSSQLRVFAPPDNWTKCSLDLRNGYQNMIKRDDSKKEYLDDMLRWIICNKVKFLPQQLQSEPESGNNSNKGLTLEAKKSAPSNVLKVKDTVFKSLNTDFVCWRGLMTCLLCVPYENQDELMISVIRFRGTYYMCEMDTESKKQQILQRTSKHEEMLGWGYKFEQYVTADKVSRVPDTKSPVNNKVAFCSIARTRLTSHSVVFGAEVDCQDPDVKKGNPYMELKTSRVIEHQRQHVNFCKFKLIKWWAQSFLIGIPRIVCGFRDDEGIVRSLQNFPVKDLPAMAESCVREPWKPTVCFNFLDAFLQFVKSNITTDNERCAYIFRWHPGSHMTCQKQGDDPEFLFLPDWFTKWSNWDTEI